MSSAVDRLVSALGMHGCGPKWAGASLHAKCPAHDDRRDSLSGSEGDDGRALVYCHAGCRVEDVIEALGLSKADLFERTNGGRQRPRIVKTYDYTDELGALLFQAVRYHPKDFKFRRPDGTGKWIWKLGETRRTLYRLPEVIATAKDGGTVYVTEGERDADAINDLPDGNMIATTNPGGAGKWRREYAEVLRGASVVIVADKDEAGRKHARSVANSLAGVAAEARIVEAREGKDAADHLAADYGLGDFVPIADRQPPSQTLEETRAALASTVGVFRKWLHLPDPDLLYAVFGAVAANRLPGDPVWLLVVGGSSWGKSEVLSTTRGLPDIHPAATITEAALLSGTPAKEKAKGAKGGLLRVIGEYGIVLCKDFGSVLNMNRDARASVLAAMREVYDGSWTRHVGTEGGRTLHWTGRVGFLGGCTGTIDRHHGVMSSMGERFIFFRVPERDAEKLAVVALKQAGREAGMRLELTKAVSYFFEKLRFDQDVPQLTPEEQTRLVALTTLVVRCRSAVERDSYSREIELVPGVESPGRLTRVLAKLLSGLRVIGLDRGDTWRVAERIAKDSMPVLRRKVLNVLALALEPQTTTEVAKAAAYPTQTSRRQLEDLACYGVIQRDAQGPGKADLWSLSPWTETKLETLGGREQWATVPGMSKGVNGEKRPIHKTEYTDDDITGKDREVALWPDS